jgi:hypothetical protein
LKITASSQPRRVLDPGAADDHPTCQSMGPRVFHVEHRRGCWSSQTIKEGRLKITVPSQPARMLEPWVQCRRSPNLPDGKNELAPNRIAIRPACKMAGISAKCTQEFNLPVDRPASVPRGTPTGMRIGSSQTINEGRLKITAPANRHGCSNRGREMITQPARWK